MQWRLFPLWASVLTMMKQHSETIFLRMPWVPWHLPKLKRAMEKMAGTSFMKSFGGIEYTCPKAAVRSSRPSLPSKWHELLGRKGGALLLFGYMYARTTDTQWRHRSKKSENLGRCGRQNMLRPYLKIWEWELIFGRAVKAISSPGVRSPCIKHSI